MFQIFSTLHSKNTASARDFDYQFRIRSYKTIQSHDRKFLIRIILLR